MENYFEKQFELRYFEMNKMGVASPTTILTLLEETAADHCNSINQSLYHLLSQNVGWVLLSGVLVMDRYPKYKEKITIRTWLSSYSTIKGFRENLIYDEQQNIIGRAKGLWLFFDIEKRRPIKIFDAFIQNWSFCEVQCLVNNIDKKTFPINEAIYTKEFHVHRFDTDMNKHVNNIRYLQWTMESIPNEIVDHYFLHSIEGRFIAEAQLGDNVISFTENGNEPNSFIHTIKVKETNKVCAVATTIWKEIL